MEKRKGKITMGHEETFGSIEYTHHFDCGDGFTAMSIYICQNLSNSNL